MQVSRLSSPTATPDPLQWLKDTDPARRALGGLVGSADGGFWIDYLQPSANGLSPQLAKACYGPTAAAAAPCR